MILPRVPKKALRHISYRRLLTPIAFNINYGSGSKADHKKYRQNSTRTVKVEAEAFARPTSQSSLHLQP
jgi:hypothetical protein